MLDQSYSGENFRKILDYENRKGNFIIGKYFSDVHDILIHIKNLQNELKYLNKKYPNKGKRFEKLKTKYEKELEEFKSRKENILTEKLNQLSINIQKNNLRFDLNKTTFKNISDKSIYTIPNTPEHFFCVKQLQSNFKKLYKVKQSNRYNILKQVICLLEDNFPKYIIRTDIKNFYENIPHKLLLKKINDNLLTYFSKKIIIEILNDYKRKSGDDKGLPRGIGISAYLAELYMRDIDNKIKFMPNIIYYARYVDDILIIFSESKDGNIKYLDKIKNIIENEYGLTLHDSSKTKDYDFTNEDKRYKLEIDYLGYKIKVDKDKCSIVLSENKIAKYKHRIDLVINQYLNYSKICEKKSRKLLVKQLRYLTSNTRLLNNKKNILVGIYFNNSLINDLADLKDLDKYLQNKCRTMIVSKILKKRLTKFSFEKGFINKIFHPFNSKDLFEITKAWEIEKWQ